VSGFSSYNFSGFIYIVWLAEDSKLECETHRAPPPSFQIKNAWSITFEIIVMIVLIECFLSSDGRINTWLLLSRWWQ
jgi:hypothetical protein